MRDLTKPLLCVYFCHVCVFCHAVCVFPSCNVLCVSVMYYLMRLCLLSFNWFLNNLSLTTLSPHPISVSITVCPISRAFSHISPSPFSPFSHVNKSTEPFSSGFYQYIHNLYPTLMTHMEPSIVQYALKASFAK